VLIRMQRLRGWILSEDRQVILFNKPFVMALLIYPGNIDL